MNALMPVVTAVSLLAALGSTAVAVKLARDERRRRAARVAALAAAAGLGARGTASATDVAVPDGLHEFMPARDAEAVVGPADTAAPAPAMFGPAAPDSGSGGRQHGLLAAAAVAGVLVAFVTAATFIAGSHPLAGGTRPAVELVTLGHERTAAGLSVRGVVRNPSTAPDVRALQADVRVFDAAGLLIASRHAAVSQAALGPGQESAFAVALGDVATAARYRVSFSSGGTVLPHVDRRATRPASVTADAR